MNFEVFLIDDAEKDLFEIFNYMFQNDSPDNADHVYSEITKTILNLNQMPERGHKPKEFDRIGVQDYLEIFFKPYRIIYQIKNREVYVHCVLDGGRDLEDLLQRRLLR